MAKAGAENKVEAFEQTLRLSRRLKAPREAVFRALTDPVELAKWFGPEGVSARKVEIDPVSRHQPPFTSPGPHDT